VVAVGGEAEALNLLASGRYQAALREWEEAERQPDNAA
jgi:hypothetical protein